MGQALYRKHRPKRLSEIVGQEHITTTLDAALKTGNISHAYLFTGPKGVGKTSIARILAHEINGIPYDDDSSHMDIIEIDAASNRRIDEIRDLREKVYIAPTSSKYKVYIIDEVHMLTKEAFNALLKTLEEPPAHVIFILATTDAHKLPDTIISRTQRYSFKPVNRDKVVGLLKQMAKTEHITVSQEALELLADHGEGSFRDSISLLDQASSSGKDLEISDIQALLGMPSTSAIADLLALLANDGSSGALMLGLNELYNQGYPATSIAKQMALLVRNQITAAQLQLPLAVALGLLEQLIEVPVSHNAERLLEIILLRVHSQLQSEPTEATTVATPPKFVPAPPDLILEASVPTADPEPLPQKKKPKAAAVAPTSLADDSLWPQILQALKQKHNTLYGVVRMAQPEFSDDSLLLTFQFAFHQKRINEANNRQILMDIIRQLTGQAIGISCVYDKAAKVPAPIVVGAIIPPPTDISAISNIFGGGELLES